MQLIHRGWWWAPGAEPMLPRTPDSDLERVQLELARINATPWAATLIAIDRLEARQMPDVFGPVDDLELWHRERAAVKARADDALAVVTQLEPELLAGLSYVWRLPIDPFASLPDRLVEHVKHGAPAVPPPKARTFFGAEVLRV
jgi:hypothetical protein